MKSLLITTGVFAPDIGGPASYAKSLGARLEQNGVSVSVLTYSSVWNHSPDVDLPFRVYRVWSRWPWGVRHIIFLIRTFLCARHSELILSLSAVSTGVPAAWVATLARKPLVVRVVGDYAWEIAVQTGQTHLLLNEFQASSKTRRVRRLDRLQRAVARSATAVIVPSKYLAGIVTGWGVPHDRIYIIYNGVDLPRLDISKEDARRRLGISGNIIISAGRLVPWKGFRMLIKLMPQLLQVNQFFRLVIVGDGPDLKMLQSVVRNLGLERKVFLVGRKSSAELALFFAAADIFVLNTGYEGFSHQVLEAMAAGVPVITTTAGGNPEVIVQGSNGFLVRYNDEFNLVEAIKTLWKQAELREQMIANGRHTVAAFSIEKMYDQTHQLLTEIIK